MFWFIITLRCNPILLRIFWWFALIISISEAGKFCPREMEAHYWPKWGFRAQFLQICLLYFQCCFCTTISHLRFQVSNISSKGPLRFKTTYEGGCEIKPRGAILIVMTATLKHRCDKHLAKREFCSVYTSVTEKKDSHTF